MREDEPSQNEHTQYIKVKKMSVPLWAYTSSLDHFPHGTHGTGKTGKMTKKKNSCQGKHREFGIFVKTQGILSKHRENTGNFVLTQGILSKHRENKGNFVCSSCKFLGSKSKGYCDICCENFHFLPPEDGHVY